MNLFLKYIVILTMNFETYFNNRSEKKETIRLEDRVLYTVQLVSPSTLSSNITLINERKKS